MSKEQVKTLIDSGLDDALPPEILESTIDAANEYGHAYGSELVVLTPEHIAALMDFKMLAWTDGEYVSFLVRAPV